MLVCVCGGARYMIKLLCKARGAGGTCRNANSPTEHLPRRATRGSAPMCARAFVCACARVRVRARVCARAWMRAYVCARAYLATVRDRMVAG